MKGKAERRQPWEDRIFTVRARRCLRCGGLLVSSLAVERGYGSHCWQVHKADVVMERETPQFSLFASEEAHRPPPDGARGVVV